MERNHEHSTDSRKRSRDDDLKDAGPELSELKRGRVDSSNSSGPTQKEAESYYVLEASESGVDSPDAKQFQEDLLNILDESDEQAILGLDSVMRSFEEEILVAAPVPTTVEATSFPGVSQPDLGYLLEASDDELGLPPAVTPGEGEKVGEMDLPATVGSGVVGGYDEVLGFEEQIPNYDSYEFGFGGDSDVSRYNSNYTDNGDFVVGGLFDFSEEITEPVDDSGLQWRTESLFAL